VTEPLHPEYLRADAPIEHRSEDRLGRASLAEAIADQVIHGPPGHGLVIGITGNWGSGKTSVLRMVEESVAERSSTTIVHFNPWLFSGSQELVSRFLQELGTQLKAEGEKQGAGDRLTEAGDRLLTYAEVLEPLGWIPVIGTWLSRAGRAGKVLKGARDARRDQPSVEAQRERVRAILGELRNRVLVVIDDVDRIEREQIRDMVRLVKLVGDFPNTTHLLAYDPGPVEAALGATRKEGQAYLEKIVQVVHHIPEPPSSALVGILLEELQSITDAIDHGPFRVEDWQNVFPDGIRPFFRTVRDVRRYLNAVPVTLRVIGGEVALVDVLALETLRVFAPDAYAQLIAEAGLLTGEERAATFGSRDEDRDRDRVNDIAEAAGQFAAPTKAFIERLSRMSRTSWGEAVSPATSRRRGENSAFRHPTSCAHTSAGRSPRALCPAYSCRRWSMPSRTGNASRHCWTDSTRRRSNARYNGLRTTSTSTTAPPSSQLSQCCSTRLLAYAKSGTA
jgi:hypothetical protein